MFSIKQQPYNLLLNEKTESEILFQTTIISDVILITLEFLVTSNTAISLLFVFLQIILDIALLFETELKSLHNIDAEKIECLIRVIESTLLLCITETNSFAVMLILVISINLAFIF